MKAKVMKTIEFSKMHGLGNDFVVINAISQSIDLSAEQIRTWANRHFGIGFDQLLLIEAPRSTDTDFYYRIFNADGHEVGQCGNGARCLTRFALDQSLTKKKTLRLATNSSILTTTLQNDGAITVDMGVPKLKPADIPFLIAKQAPYYILEVDGQKLHFQAINLGNPHAVINVANINNAPIARVGTKLAAHPFFPEGVNVGFVQTINRQHIKLRVYERGVGETLACGSGACAAVVAGIAAQQLEPEVTVELSGGMLQINWQGGENSVLMTGPAVTVFEGKIRVNGEVNTEEEKSLESK